MEEVDRANMEVVNVNMEKDGRTATPTTTMSAASSAASSPDNKSLVSGLQAANTSMHALDQANRELIEALGEAQQEIERFVTLLSRCVHNFVI